MKLSILICSLKKRENYLTRLLKILETQLTDEIEVLVDIDEGQLTIGTKRNNLLRRAKGDYIAFIDDDDRVSADYISKILACINNSNPDVIGMHLIMTTDGVIEEKTFHSLQYQSWYDEQDPDRPWLRRYYRNPNHLNPVKREYALNVGFPEISMGEDKAYSTKLLQYLKTEEYIPEPIYFYDFISRK